MENDLYKTLIDWKLGEIVQWKDDAIASTSHHGPSGNSNDLDSSPIYPVGTRLWHATEHFDPSQHAGQLRLSPPIF